MRNLKMLVFIAIVTVIGCSDNDNDNHNYNPNTSVLHEWTLLKVTGTITGTTNEFPNGLIVWKFNPNNTITVNNNNTDENLQSGFPSGTYNYIINNNPLTASCPENIIINTEEFGCISINDIHMDINQNVADGINFQFEKVMPFTTD